MRQERERLEEHIGGLNLWGNAKRQKNTQWPFFPDHTSLAKAHSGRKQAQDFFLVTPHRKTYAGSDTVLLHNVVCLFINMKFSILCAGLLEGSFQESFYLC